MLVGFNQWKTDKLTLRLYTQKMSKHMTEEKEGNSNEGESKNGSQENTNSRRKDLTKV